MLRVNGRSRLPQPPEPGRLARHDPEYVRGGVANLFLVTEPLRGGRHVCVSQQRTRLDFAHCVRELIDVHYPAAERIVLVCDQLNTHDTAALYAAFPPRRRGGWPSGLSGTTRPSTATGSTWPSWS